MITENFFKVTMSVSVALYLIQHYIKEVRGAYQQLKIKLLRLVLMKPVLPTMIDVPIMIVSHCVHTLSIVFLLSVCLNLEALLLMPQIQHLLECVLTQVRLVSLQYLKLFCALMLCCVVST